VTVPNPYILRAETEGDRVKHAIVRMALLKHVGADERTLRLFEYWREKSGIGAITDDMASIVDAAAKRAGLSDRSEFLTNEAADRFLPSADLRPLKERGDQVIKQFAHSWWTLAQGFIIVELFGRSADDQVPIQAWLAADLVQIFTELERGRVFGAPTVPFRVPLSPTTVHALKKGQGPKAGGEMLHKYAEWYYRHHIARPRATLSQLANERLDEMDNPNRQPRDRHGLDDRPDTKAIRYGLDEAERLLTLTIPPDEWATYFSQFWPHQGGKTLM
jgi:hypothetical protein